MDPGSWILDPGPRTIQKIQKIGKCHETDKYPTKSDENWSIWSQTGQGNLFRGVPDPKKIQKRSNLGQNPHLSGLRPILDEKIFGRERSLPLMVKSSGEGCRVLAQGRRNEVRLGLSRTSVYETTESDAPGALG